MDDNATNQTTFNAPSCLVRHPFDCRHRCTTARTQLDAPDLLPLAAACFAAAAAPHRLSIARFLGLLRVGRVSRGTELASLVVKLESFKPIIGLYFLLPRRGVGHGLTDTRALPMVFFFCVDGVEV
jgi:hypothetical protein